MPGIATLAIAATFALPGSAQPPAADPAAVAGIVALDPRWTVAFETPPAAAAGFDQEMAYVPVKGGDLIAIDLTQGAVRWTTPLATAMTPATGDGLVFAASDSLVTALNQRTGLTEWRRPVGQPIARALFWDAGWLLASTEAGELMALRGEDGRLLWRTALGSPVVAPPTTAADRVYLALADGSVVAVALERGDVQWRFPLGEAVTGMQALDDQLLVGTRADRLHSLSLGSGRVRWSQRAGADVAGAPLADEERIYFAALDNIIRALDRRNGNLKWLQPLPSRPAGGPLRTENVVLVPLVTTDIGAFDAVTGTPAFTIRAVGELGSVPFLRDRPRPTAPRLVAMSREGALQGFAARFEPPLAPLKAFPGTPLPGSH